MGHCGVWGINADQVVYFRLNTFGDPDDEGTGWIRVEGRFQTIYSGPKAVLALAGNRDIYYRANLVRRRTRSGDNVHPVLFYLHNLEEIMFAILYVEALEFISTST